MGYGIVHLIKHTNFALLKRGIHGTFHQKSYAGNKRN